MRGSESDHKIIDNTNTLHMQEVSGNMYITCEKLLNRAGYREESCSVKCHQLIFHIKLNLEFSEQETAFHSYQEIVHRIMHMTGSGID